MVFGDGSDILEARNSESKAWAHVQNLSYALDEHNLETCIEMQEKNTQNKTYIEAYKYTFILTNLKIVIV